MEKQKGKAVASSASKRSSAGVTPAPKCQKLLVDAIKGQGSPALSLPSVVGEIADQMFLGSSDL